MYLISSQNKHNAVWALDRVGSLAINSKRNFIMDSDVCMNIEVWTTTKLKKIMRLLANRNYEPLSIYLEENVNDIDNFLMWVHDYCDCPDGKKIVTYPPDDIFHNGNSRNSINERAKEHCKKGLREFWGCFDLWVDNEESDLTLEYEVVYLSDNDIRFYMSNIHVL